MDSRLGFEFAFGLKANDFHSTVDEDSHQQLLTLAERGVALSRSISSLSQDFHARLQDKVKNTIGLSQNSLMLVVLFVLVTGLILYLQYRNVRGIIQKRKSQ